VPSDGGNSEVRAALDAAKALGYLGAYPKAEALLDRCSAILWRLAHG